MNSKKIRVWLVTGYIFFRLMLSANFTSAQGLTLPCDGGDPDVDCPIDDALILLVGTTAVFTAIKLSRLQSGKTVNQSSDSKI